MLAWCEIALFHAAIVPCDAPKGVVSNIQDLQYLKNCQVLDGSLQLSLSVSSNYICGYLMQCLRIDQLCGM